jgi:hypothetical protein
MRLDRRAVAGLLACILAAVTCRDIGAVFGPTPAEARVRLDDFFGSLARRFGPHELDPRLRTFRARVTAAAFSPERLFVDSAAWPAHDGSARLAVYVGAPGSAGRYRSELRASAPAPSRPGESRSQVRLTRLNDGDFEWTQRDELAVGRLAAGDAARALTRALLLVESAPAEQAGQALRAALPHSARALGRGLSLERVHLRRDSHDATSVLLGARLHTGPLRAAGFGGYARYLEKYVARLRFKATLQGASNGAPFWTVDAFEGRVLVTFRSRRGELVSLSGAPRPLPDVLTLRSDFSTPAGLFRVGLTGLPAEVRLVRAPREKSAEAVFTREPEWQLPFVVRPFLRASLRRPFDAPGARLALSLQEQPEGGTWLVREYRLAVRESWLVRWLGGLGGNAVVAFRRDAEDESDRFVFEAFDALRRDLGGEDRSPP